MLLHKMSDVGKSPFSSQPTLLDRICNEADDSREKVRAWPDMIPDQFIVEPCYVIVEPERPLCTMLGQI